MDDPKVDLTEFEDEAAIPCTGKVPGGGKCGNVIRWMVSDTPHQHEHVEFLCGGHKLLLDKTYASVNCRECGEEVTLTFTHL